MDFQPQSTSSSLVSVVQTALRGAFWFILLFSIVSYGGNNPLALTLSTAGTFLILPVAFLAAGGIGATRTPFWLGLYLFAGLALWVLLQTASLPGNPYANPAWFDIRGIAERVSFSISVTPGDAMLGLVKAALPMGMFALALVLFDTDAHALRALKIVSLSGGAVAILSLVQFLAFPDVLLITQKLYYLDSLTGPFINRNTAGTLFGVLSVSLFAFCWKACRRIDGSQYLAALEARRPSGQSKQIWIAVLYGVMLVAVLMALFLTKSRAAAGSTFIALVVLIALLVSAPGGQKSMRVSRRKSWRLLAGRVAMGLGLVAMLLVVYTGFAGRVLMRTGARGLVDDRFCVMPGIAAAIRDHWPVGAGLTSFRDVFPAYRDPACGITGVWDKAHNFYAEGLLTLGVAFPAIVMPAVFVLLAIYLKGRRSRRRLRFVSAIGFSSLVLVAIHSVFDFSLQIPGFTTFFAAFTALVVTICSGRSEKRARSGTRENATAYPPV